MSNHSRPSCISQSACVCDRIRLTISYDPDFNTKSLRGNVVLPWEYVRGCTLFVVWDLSQADYSRRGVFKPWSDIVTAFGAEPTHTLIVKVSYWINQ